MIDGTVVGGLSVGAGAAVTGAGIIPAAAAGAVGGAVGNGLYHAAGCIW